MTDEFIELPTKDGQLVEVVLRGRVEIVSSPQRFRLGVYGERNSIYPDADHVVSMKVLPEPVPEWQVGDVVYYSNNGTAKTWVRGANTWACSTWEVKPADLVINQDIYLGYAVPLVRGGQLVERRP